MLPPQITPVGERLSKFVEGWKHITNDPSVLSIVAKGYRLRFTSPPLLRQTPWEISSPQDPQEILGMREQITLTLQKNAITEVPREFSRVRRITYSWYGKLQEGERSHSRTSFPYVHDKLCAKLCSKRRLHVRNRPAGCVLSRTYSSQQQKVPQVHLRKQGVPVSSATVRSEHRPSGFYSIGAPVTGYLHRQGISVIPYRDDWLIHHPERQVLIRHQAQLINTLDLVGSILNRKKSELDLTQDLQFLGIRLRLDLGEASLPESKAWEIVARVRHLSSLRVLTYSQVSQLMGSLSWASGLIPLGRLYLRPLQRHFHSLGLTDRFTPPRRSDPLVLANLLRQWQDPLFLTSGIPIRTFQADLTIFTDAFTQGWGARMGDSKISGTWTLTDRKLHINCLELKAVIFALQHWALLLQGHQVMIATDNSTVVSYINKQGGTRSPPCCV